MDMIASQITSLTGLCAGNSPATGEFPAQMASDAENVSIWWRHYILSMASHLFGAIIWTNAAGSLSGGPLRTRFREM